MITAVWGFITSPMGKYLAIAAALALVAIGVTAVLDTTFNRGETAGKAAVTTAVQGEALKRDEAARIKKEKINVEISKESPDAVLDRTR